MPLTTPQPKLDQAMDQFIEHILPGWLKSASPDQLDALQTAYRAHMQSQDQVAQAFATLQPLDAFAKRLLEQALQDEMKLSVDLSKACWREQRRKFTVNINELPIDEHYFHRVPALQRLLQNFTKGESFYNETALVYPASGEAGSEERVLTTDTEKLVTLCRELDVGKRYQDHLGEVFDSDFRVTLAHDLRLTFELVIEIADARRLLPAMPLRLLRNLVWGKRLPLKGAQQTWLRFSELRMLGCGVAGMYALEISRSHVFPGIPPVASSTVTGVLLLVPGDLMHPVQHFDSWSAVNTFLQEKLHESDQQGSFVRRVALNDRARFQQTLAERLADDKTDLELGLVYLEGELFDKLARHQLARIQADAGFLAVPSAAVDAKLASERLQALEALGSTLLTLAGLLVPGVGDLLLADLVAQTLSQLCEGVQDWSRGHQHEAQRHFLDVAQNVAINAAIAGGAKLKVRAFTRSPLVDAMQPVLNEAGQQRLWVQDLAPYRDANPPEQLVELGNGLHSDGTRHWWLHQGVYFRVRSRGTQDAWRLEHPRRPAAFGPGLESNGERAWRLFYERPLEWRGARFMLERLWPATRLLSEARVANILKVAAIDEDYLRGLLVENRPLPVTLRDTLERFAVDARVERFLAGVTRGDSDTELWQWCMDDLGIQGLAAEAQGEAFAEQAAGLHERMLEHFSKDYLASDPQLGLLRRVFSGLPDAYALNVLKQVTLEQRVVMRRDSRVPLAVAQQARRMAQIARLTRMREGLYLQGSQGPDVVELVFALLRQEGRWPASAVLELREGSASGRLLSRLQVSPSATSEATVMVRRDGRFELYTAAGQPFDTGVAEPQGVFEALLACLPAADRQRLGWDDAQAPQRLRDNLQALLPTGNRELLQLVGLHEVGAPHDPLQRLPDGRFGYLLSGRGVGIPLSPNSLRARIGVLYPSLNEQEMQTYVDLLLQRPGAAYASLLEQEREYRHLCVALERWSVRGPEMARREASRTLRRNWRLIGERITDAQGRRRGLRLSLDGVPLRELPELPADTGFGHVAELTLTGLGIEQMPVSFLHCFPHVRRLDMSNNRLRDVPANLALLRRLESLCLANNQICLTSAGVQTLQHMVGLQTLDLSGNPLGSINVPLRPLVRLQRLILRGTNLGQVPHGLEWCGLLEVADLRDNRIATIPESMFELPRQLRAAIELDGNPLPEAVRTRMRVGAPAAASDAHAGLGNARAAWLATLEEAEREVRGRQWDTLRAEPGSSDFFDLLSELTGSSDYRAVWSDLGRRVWAMIVAASDDTHLRAELFSLAANPRTCVDSVAACFSVLEVRVLVAQALRESEPIMARAVRLRMARRMFRLDEVERIAREDVQGRLAQGGEVDEVEVALAYRTGLAAELELPGQPRTMQFQALAEVSARQLSEAAAAVRRLEASPALARYVSQRDFWLQSLRDEHAEAFAEVEAPFWTRLDELGETALAVGEGQYLVEVERLADERRTAVEALALRLTEQALARPAEVGS